MISIIAGTNRAGSNTLKIAEQVHEIMRQKGQEAQVLNLELLPSNLLHTAMYAGPENQSEDLAQLQDKFMLASSKWYWVIPEYNGSFPGVVKLFIDACSIRKYKETFFYKKSALLGISDGRAGNLRGMEHLTGILNHLNVTVMPNRQPLSNISQLLDKEGQIKEGRKTIEDHIEQFIAF